MTNATEKIDKETDAENAAAALVPVAPDNPAISDVAIAAEKARILDAINNATPDMDGAAIDENILKPLAQLRVCGAITPNVLENTYLSRLVENTGMAKGSFQKTLVLFGREIADVAKTVTVSVRDPSTRIIKLDKSIINDGDIYAWTLPFRQDEVFNETNEINGKQVSIKKGRIGKKILLIVYRFVNGTFVEYQYVHEVKFKAELNVIEVPGLDGIVFTWESKRFMPINRLDKMLNRSSQDSMEGIRGSFLSLLKSLVVLQDESEYLFLFYETLHNLVYRISSHAFIHVIYGATSSGKSTLLKILARLILTSYIVIDPSNATIFRMADAGNSLFIDEFNKIVSDGGKDKELQEFLALIRAGTEEGVSVPRCEGDYNTPRFFDAYCPKIIASEHPIPPGLESARNRMITTCMMTALKPVERTDSHEGELLQLRDQIASFMSSYFPRVFYLSHVFGSIRDGKPHDPVPDELAAHIKNMEGTMDAYRGLSARMQDLSRSIMVLASWNKEDLDKMVKFFREQQRCVADRTMEDNAEYDFLRCLGEMCDNKIEPLEWTQKDGKKVTIPTNQIYYLKPSDSKPEHLTIYIGLNLYRLLQKRYTALEYNAFKDQVRGILTKYSIQYKETNPGNKLQSEMEVLAVGRALDAKKHAIGEGTGVREEIKTFDVDEIQDGEARRPAVNPKDMIMQAIPDEGIAVINIQDVLTKSGINNTIADTRSLLAEMANERNIKYDKPKDFVTLA